MKMMRKVFELVFFLLKRKKIEYEIELRFIGTKEKIFLLNRCIVRLVIIVFHIRTVSLQMSFFKVVIFEHIIFKVVIIEQIKSHWLHSMGIW